jgi:hypothetical protein
VIPTGLDGVTIDRVSALPDDRAAGPADTGSQDRKKEIAAAALGGLAVLFAALNFDEVEVNWILGTWSTPLVVVILVSFLLGAVGGLLLASRRTKRRP